MHMFDTTDGDERFRAPELRVTTWLNQPGSHRSLPDPITLAGRTVLVDFWDHTCINCLHTLPYLRAWHTRYAPHGLVILGIHAAEFPFADNATLVETAVRTLDLPYPVGLDARRETFSAYACRYWPAKYLVDAAGFIRAFHYGEGAYGEMEEAIQCVLAENGADAAQFPDVLAPVRETDAPGALCYEVSPELYLGHRRGSFGNVSPHQQEKTVAFALPTHLGQDLAYLAGPWRVMGDHAESAPASDPDNDSPESSLTTLFTAAGVNAVFCPPADEPVLVRVMLDDQPVPAARRGADLLDVDGQTMVRLSRPGMVNLLTSEALVTGKLTLSVSDPGVALYTLTFVTCVSQESAVC